jgi:hypothetical protein
MNTNGGDSATGRNDRNSIREYSNDEMSQITGIFLTVQSLNNVRKQAPSNALLISRNAHGLTHLDVIVTSQKEIEEWAIISVDFSWKKACLLGLNPGDVDAEHRIMFCTVLNIIFNYPRKVIDCTDGTKAV